MFRACARHLGVSPYSLFLQEQRSHPQLQGLTIGARAKQLSKMFRDLSATERESLNRRAAACESFVRVGKNMRSVMKEHMPKRQLSAYNLFVKAVAAEVRHLPRSQRLKTVSTMWKKHLAQTSSEKREVALKLKKKSDGNTRNTETVHTAKAKIKAVEKNIVTKKEN